MAPTLGTFGSASIVSFGGRMPRRRAAPGSTFSGGNVSYASLRDFGLDAVESSSASITAGGTLSINSEALGSYDYRVVVGDTTVSSFTVGDWFTATQDTRSACIFVRGNLTINAGITFIPSVRKLFTFVYVKGNLTLNGTLSMTQRGANHRGTGTSGGATTAAAIRIATGTFSAVTNPEIPASGGGGGQTNAAAGTAGTAGGTGGGGAGSGSPGVGGKGSAGTSFTGGSGGGGSGQGVAGGNAEDRGGRGGNAASSGNWTGAGSGNPGGTAIGTADSASGTGGVLVIICTGTFSGTGSAQANGVRGGNSYGSGGSDGHGGGTGGGSVTIMFGTDTSSITPTASGGAGGVGSGPSGGAGGAGTARKLALA